ncbi:MAG: PH domain-containing protein [Herbinix sp.]|nr:PH domain-containing protein [Herbinix sp.]
MVYVERKRTKLLGLPLSYTKYTISEERLRITSGFLSIIEDDCFMYKIQDVRLTRSFMERIFKLGTITCYTGDTTHPKLELEHIKQAGTIKDFIMYSSEEARRKRRARRAQQMEAENSVEDAPE